MARPKAIKIIIQRSVIEVGQFYFERCALPNLIANYRLFIDLGSFFGVRCKPENFTTP
jgi:hypothetical protein